MVQVNIKKLIDDVQCYQTVRDLRWPDGIECPACQSTQVIKRGFDDTEPARQRYECTDCHKRFDDVTDTIFAGHHQPLKVWILCLYFRCSPANTLKIEKPTLQLGLHMNNPTEGLAYEETPRLGPTVPQPRLLPVQSYA